MLAPEFADVVLNQTEPLGLFSSAVFHVGLEVCAACKNCTPLATPDVMPNEALSPVPESNLIVLVPSVESPNAPPLWNISRLPVIDENNIVVPTTSTKKFKKIQKKPFGTLPKLNFQTPSTNNIKQKYFEYIMKESFSLYSRIYF